MDFWSHVSRENAHFVRNISFVNIITVKGWFGNVFVLYHIDIGTT